MENSETNKKDSRSTNKSAIAIVLLSITLGVALVIIAMLTIGTFMQAGEVDEITSMHNYSLEAGYQDNIYMAVDGLSVVESDLEKLALSQSASMEVGLASELSANAAATSSYVSKLPLGYEMTQPLQKFLHQVSEWGTYYAMQIASGNIPDEEANIESMIATAKELKASITATSQKFDGEYLVHENLDEEGYYSDLLGGAEINYPSLVYDGLFTDEIKERTLLAVENEMEVSEHIALTLARDNYGVYNGEIISSDDEDIYSISGMLGELAAEITLTKRGGLLLELTVDDKPEGEHYSMSQAIEKAEAVASEYGYCEHLAVVWENSINSCAYIDLCPVVDDIIYYTDMVKVRINLTNLSVIGLQAYAYGECYHEREAASMMNENAVPTLVSSKLSISEINRAVIPYNGTEVLCYEVIGTYSGSEYFIYLDGKSGDEIKLQLAQKEDQGRMLY